MANERITENLVRDQLREHGYYKDGVTVEEQISQIEGVKRLLKSAGKKDNGGRGAPEFIISTTAAPDFLIVIECKAASKHHESVNRDKPSDFAVDGVLHYSSVLSKSFNIVAIAVSGQTASGLKISCFLHARGQQAQPLTNKDSVEIKRLIPLDDFIEHASFDPEVTKNRTDDLMAFSRELHDFMRDHAKLTESEKPLLVSGTLIALRNQAFAKSFSEFKPDKLQSRWHEIIKEEF